MSSEIDTPKHSDLIYDVGLHMGEDTEFYLKKGFRVVAFEANPELVKLCKSKFGGFLDDGRLVIIEGAIVAADDAGQAARTVRFFINEKSIWGTVNANWMERNARMGAQSKEIEVDVVDFCGVVRKHGMPHYMKIDIEGCDTICINELRRFRERPDYISFESDKTSFTGIRSEIAMLEELGYREFQAIEQSGIPSQQSPPYPAREGQYAEHRFVNGTSGLFGRELEDNWKGKAEVLRQYRFVRLGYFLLGDDGVMTRWRFKGAWRLQQLVRRLLSRLTRAAIPGWYDTHARHSSVDAKQILRLD